MVPCRYQQPSLSCWTAGVVVCSVMERLLSTICRGPKLAPNSHNTKSKIDLSGTGITVAGQLVTVVPTNRCPVVNDIFTEPRPSGSGCAIPLPDGRGSNE